MSHIETTQY